MPQSSEPKQQDVFLPAPSIFFTLGELLQGDDNKFVGNAYWAVFGRSVDIDGLNVYTALLAEGKSRIEVLIELRRAAEAKAHGASIDGLDAAKSLPELLSHQDHAFVSCAYQTLLLRPVDAGALARYVVEFSSGMTPLQVLNEIRSSDEFKLRDGMACEIERIAHLKENAHVALVGDSRDADGSDSRPDSNSALPSSMSELVARGNAHFIQGLYQVLLGRHVDAGGLENYLTLMRSGISRQEVMRGISQSEEREARRAMLRQLDSAIIDVGLQQHPLLGWTATLRSQKLDQLVAKLKFRAMERQLIAMNHSLKGQLERVSHTTVQHGAGTVVMHAQKKRALKLNQLSPLARDVYFQIKNGLDERKEGGV